MPLFIMETAKLVEKQLAEHGLASMPVSWQHWISGNVMNDALLSGNLEIANGGVPPFLTFWARAKGSRSEIGALSAVSDIPSTLTTINPRVKTLRDFTENDRISVAAVKASQVAILLQMAAEKEFGSGNYAQLDHLTVGLGQPESMSLLLSGKSEITAHFTVPPFSNRELRDPRVRRVLSSIDILGGVNTVVIAYASKAFYDTNTKAIKAYLAALAEACEMIVRDRKSAIELYAKASGDKTSAAELDEILTDPALRYTLQPTGTMMFADFMHRVGSIKVKPFGWKDIFFPDVHHLPGS